MDISTQTGIPPPDSSIVSVETPNLSAIKTAPPSPWFEKDEKLPLVLGFQQIQNGVDLLTDFTGKNETHF